MAKIKGRFSTIHHEHPRNVLLEFAQAIDVLNDTDRVTVLVLHQHDETSPAYPYPGIVPPIQHEEWCTAQHKLKFTPTLPGIYTLRVVAEHLGKPITFKSLGVAVDS